MNLTRDNYFSKEAESLFLGSSSYKAWDIFHGGCEAKEVAKKNGNWIEKENDSFLIGSYVHAWNSNDLEEFKENNKKLFKKDGSLYAKYEIAEKMIEVLKKDELVQKFRKDSEMEKIFTGTIGGVQFKIQVDILNIKRGYFADIKTTKNINETYYNSDTKKRESFIDKYDYFTQIAIYAEILRQNLNSETYLEPYLIVVDKQEFPDHSIIQMGTNFIKEKLEEIESRLPRIEGLRSNKIKPFRCGKCDYCRSTKKSKIITIDDYKEELGIGE